MHGVTSRHLGLALISSLLVLLLLSSQYYHEPPFVRAESSHDASVNAAAAYAFGMVVAAKAAEMGLSEGDFRAGISAQFAGSAEFDLQTAGNMVQNYQKLVDDKLKEASLAEARAFFAENGEKEGVSTTPSGLQYKITKPGSGVQPDANDKVFVNYVGKYLNGDTFDTNLRGENSKPVSFKLNGVIKGWGEGMQLVGVGARATFWIPQDLGYGAKSPPGMPKYSLLVFEVELIGVEKVPDR